MRPTIAMPLCLDAGGRWRSGRVYEYVDVAYARAIEAAGGRPVYIPLEGDPARAAEALAGASGLLLPGGDDLLPPPGNSAATPAHVFAAAPAERVAFDRGLLASARARGLPFLGICYGAQLLALECDAALCYDLPTERPDALDHSASGAGEHAIEVVPGTRLALSLGDGATRVNSRHHQAVADPGATLRVSAQSPDGVIEAIEEPGPGFSVGVQWHPEALDDAGSRALFRDFVAACRSSA